MTFPFNIYFGAFFAAVLASALCFPLWQRWCESSGHVDDPGHRKIHSKSVPLAGGLTVMTGFFLPILFGALVLYLSENASFDSTLRDLLQYGLSRRGLQVVAILLGAFGMVLVGWLDDRFEFGGMFHIGYAVFELRFPIVHGRMIFVTAPLVISARSQIANRNSKIPTAGLDILEPLYYRYRF